jgi:hypothetical protein
MMSAFVHLKPLLGALYSWITAVDHCNTPQVPAAVLMFLKATMIPEVARTKVRVAPEVEGDHIFRSDAKAEGENVVLGGWCCGDSPERGKCRWFSVNRSNAPWVFESGEPYRAIASLELLGTLASITAFPPKDGEHQKLLSFGGHRQLGKPAPCDPLPHYEIPVVHRADAAGLDATLQRFGAPTGLASEVTKPGGGCAHQR